MGAQLRGPGDPARRHVHPGQRGRLFCLRPKDRRHDRLLGSELLRSGDPPAGAFTQVSAGASFACGLKTDGTIACWGADNNGQTTPPAGTFTQVSAGAAQACGIKSDGTIACWGANSYGQLATPPAGTFTQVSAGAAHTCGIKSDGTIACWGDNPNGQATPPAGTFTQVSAGGYDTCGLKTDGTIACWGDNTYGQTTPPAGTFTQVSAGPIRICGLEADQSVACWGYTAIAESGNNPPAALPGGPYVGFEGTPVVLNLSGADPDGNALQYSWDLGDGTNGRGPLPPASHTYADNGSYTITLTVSDQNGGTDTKSTTASIANVAPTIPAGGLTGPLTPLPLTGGSAMAPVTLAFSDPAGTRDTYAAQIQCGNGTVLTASAITSPYSGTCAYSAAGIYTLRATVADDDGGISPEALFQYVVVYDPAGAFTTGGGWFTSVAADCPTLCSGTSRAHFAFNVKFLPGQSTAPDGAARVWLQNQRLELKSTNLEMLVVYGTRVQFWGGGTMNGVPGYSFRITAEQGHAGVGAAIRVEIWDGANTLIYDTQTGAPQDAAPTRAIEAGEIAVHQQ